jgi:hypothetical protein
MRATPGDLMATARAETGLDDFGDDAFRQGLEILVRSLRDEARLNGEDVSVVLETERGTTTIHGETALSTFMVLGPLEGFARCTSRSCGTSGTASARTA